MISFHYSISCQLELNVFVSTSIIFISLFFFSIQFLIISICRCYFIIQHKFAIKKNYSICMFLFIYFFFLFNNISVAFTTLKRKSKRMKTEKMKFFFLECQCNSLSCMNDIFFARCSDQRQQHTHTFIHLSKSIILYVITKMAINFVYFIYQP